MGIDPVSLAITVALNAATMAMTASQQIEGPRLSDLSVTVADYGTPLNYFKGTSRLEVPVFFAEPLRETRVQNKTKGGKYNNYKYSGTFAVVIADQEIDSVLRIWLDRRLAYDQSSPGAVSDSLNLRDYMRIYLGTSTQEPDERMVATIEAEEGAGTCPAYRDVAYIIFEDLPLEVFGNRFPQVSVEAQSNSVPAYPTDSIQGTQNGGRLFNATFSSNGQKFAVGFGTLLDVYDLKSRTLMQSINLDISIEAETSVGLFDDGTIYAMADNNDDLIIIEPSGKQTVYTGYTNQESVYVLKDGNGEEHWITQPWSLFKGFYLDGVRLNPSTVFGYNVKLRAFCTDAYGDIWAAGSANGPFVDATELFLFRLVNVSGRAANGGNSGPIPMPSGGDNPNLGIHHSDEDSHFVCRWNNRFYFIDDEDLTIKSFTTFSSFPPFEGDKQFNAIPYGANSAYFGSTTTYEVDMTDGSIIRTIPLAPWGVADTDSVIYSKYLHAMLTFGSIFDSTRMNILYLDRTSTDEVTLAEVFGVVADQVGLSASDYDVSALDQIVEGYSWTQGSGKQIIAPLMQWHDSFIRPNGFLIEGKKRGGAVEGSEVGYQHFVRENDEDDAIDLYEITMLSESDLPRRISVTYADLDAEQQPNTAVSQRAEQSVLTKREVSIDLSTLSTTPDTAQPLVDRLLRRPWIGAVMGRQVLPPYLLEFAPGDVRNFRFDDDNLQTGFVTAMIIRPNRTFEVRWERDFPAASALRTSPGAPALGRPVATVYDPVDSIGFVIDTGLIDDTHDQTTPFVYTAAAPRFTGSWPGADMQQSVTGADDSFTSGFDVFLSSEGVQWAYVESGNYNAAVGVPDRETELRLRPQAGFEISSASEDDLIADPTLNLALWGVPGRWEIVQFEAADLQSTNEWTVQPRLRGLRGTERFISQHEDGDYFILYSSSWHRRGMGASKLSTTDYYRALTFGLSEFPYGSTEAAFTGEANRPLSVANLQVKRSASGDFTISWQRRTRIGGDSIDGQDVPLGETAELYNVRIVDGLGNAIRTVQTSATEFEYDTYTQIEDFGSEQSGVTVTVAQVSPALNLEGHAVQATG